MSGGEDIEMLAAEYALGTLDAQERRAVERRLPTDPDLRRALEAWEARLSPLAGAVPEVTPPAGLRDRVLARIPDSSDAAGPAADVVDLTRRLRRWQRISGAAMALAASLALVIGVREATRQPQTEFVGVFHPNDETPAFLLTIDLHARAVTIRPVAAPPQPGKTYQLWIASDALGPRPRSLGLLNDGADTKAQITLPIDQQTLRRATFGVSVEPAGGSPTGVPTGPALHTKLLPISG